MFKPLLNKTIVITRSSKQSDNSISVLEISGAEVIQFPTIKIVDPESFDLFDESVNNFSDFDFIIFTSVNAVEKFKERIERLNHHFDFGTAKVIVTGSKTAEACKDADIKVDIIPNKYSAEGILEELSSELKGKKIFIPCSAIARKELSEGLISAGTIVTKVPIYDVAIPDKDEIKENISSLNNCKPDVYIFTSPSTFRNFLKILNIKNVNEYFKDALLAAIGTTTESEIISYGLNVDFVPELFTMESLAEEIINHFEKLNLTIE